MRALRVFEEMSFQRGIDPKVSMGIGVMSKFEEVFNKNFSHWINIPEMARILYNEGAISKKGEAVKVAAFCVDLRKRGYSDRAQKYKLYVEIGRSPNIGDKLTLMKYAIACIKDKTTDLMVPVKVAVARNDEELFNRIKDITEEDKWNSQIAKIIRHSYSSNSINPDWWVKYVNEFSAGDKMQSGFLEEYKKRMEERLERINKILGGDISDEDKKWMKSLEKSYEYSNYNRESKNIRLDY